MRYLFILALMSSCAPLYLSGTRNTPLFKEQGEAQISGYLSAAGVEGQVAYALTDNIAMIGGYSYANQKKTSNGAEYTRKNGIGEIGLGYYNRTRTSRYEIFAGYSFGEGTSSDVYYFILPVETVTTAKMKRFFIQPSIGSNNRNVNLSFTPRISWVDFSDFTGGGVGPVTPNEKTALFFEPAATLKVHLTGNIFGVLQLGVTVPFGEPYFKYQSLQGSIGLQIDTGGLSTRVYK